MSPLFTDNDKLFPTEHITLVRVAQINKYFSANKLRRVFAISLLISTLETTNYSPPRGG